MPLFSYFPVGIHSAARVKQWAQEIKDIVKGDRIAVDMVVPDALHALEAEGFEVVPAQPLKEHAAVIKSPEEIACTMHACTVGEVAMAKMRAALEPGMTENELYAVLHHTNIAMGGEWIEYRLLAAGGHINPWTVETGDKIIRPGELVAKPQHPHDTKHPAPRKPPMTASIGPLANPDYYLRMQRSHQAANGYYTGGGEPDGIWWNPAGLLGLKHGAPVGTDAFYRLCDGFSPDGEKLTQNAGSEKRSAGLDLTFSADAFAHGHRRCAHRGGPMFLKR